MCRDRRVYYYCGHSRIEKVKCVKKAHRERFCLFTLFSSPPECDNTRKKTLESPNSCSSCQAYLKQSPREYRPVQWQPLQQPPPARTRGAGHAAVPAGRHNHHSQNRRQRVHRHDSFLEPALQAALTTSPGVDYAPHVQNRYPAYSQPPRRPGPDGGRVVYVSRGRYTSAADARARNGAAGFF